MISDVIRFALNNAIGNAIKNETCFDNVTHSLTPEGWKFVFQETFGRLPQDARDPCWELLMNPCICTGLAAFSVIRKIIEQNNS